MNLFTETSLSPEILKAVGELGFVSPTEIQKQTIPFIFAISSHLRKQEQAKQQHFRFRFWI